MKTLQTPKCYDKKRCNPEGHWILPCPGDFGKGPDFKSCSRYPGKTIVVKDLKKAKTKLDKAGAKIDPYGFKKGIALVFKKQPTITPDLKKLNKNSDWEKFQDLNSKIEAIKNIKIITNSRQYNTELAFGFSCEIDGIPLRQAYRAGMISFSDALKNFGELIEGNLKIDAKGKKIPNPFKKQTLGELKGKGKNPNDKITEKEFIENGQLRIKK